MARVGRASGVQRLGPDHLGGDQIGELRQRDDAVRLQRDLRKVGLALERLGAGIAIDQQHRQLVAHGECWRARCCRP